MITAILAAAVCHVGGAGLYTKPDQDCTPGSYDRLTTAQVCRHKTRPQLPVASRTLILTAYGVPNWTGTNGELDHRVPFFLGGRTNTRNIWPERGPIPNPKDRLEAYTHERVCFRHTMRVRTAINLFLDDWVLAYRRYFG